MKKIILTLNFLCVYNFAVADELSPDAKVVFARVVVSQAVTEQIAAVKVQNRYCRSELEERISNIRVVQLNKLLENKLLQVELASCEVGKDCLIFEVNFNCQHSSSNQFGGYRLVVSTDMAHEVTSVGPVETIIW